MSSFLSLWFFVSCWTIAFSQTTIWFDDMSDGSAWTTGGSAFFGTSYNPDGCDDNNGDCLLLYDGSAWAYCNPLDLSGYTNIKVEFTLCCVADQLCYYFEYSINGGSSWRQQFVIGNVAEHQRNESMPAECNNAASFQVRFRMACSGANDDCWTDSLYIKGIPATSNPTTSEPTTSEPTTTNPTTTSPTTSNPTTNNPTIATSEPTTSPTTNNPTTNDKEIDMMTTLIFGTNEDESNVTGATGDTATIIIVIIIVVVMILLLLTGIVFFYFKQRKTNHKKKLETNINNIEIGQIKQNKIKGCESCDDDIVAQVNQTTIGNNERSDDDLIAAVNETDIANIGVDNSDIPPNVSKINSISNEDDLDEVQHNYNNEEEDLIQTINNTAGGNENDIDQFVVDGDSDNEQMIEPGSNTMGMKVNAIGESEGVNYILDEDGAKEVRLWLDSIGFDMYYDILVNNGFDSMESIQEIRDENDLSGIGVKLKGHQLKLLKYIKMSKTYHP